MTFEGLNFAFSIEGVSPVARLLAFALADRFTYVGEFEDVSTDDPLLEADLLRCTPWIGAPIEDMEVAFDELVKAGLRTPEFVAQKVRYRFPLSSKPARPLAPEQILQIYVVSAGTASKIGISWSAKHRLTEIQASNPNEILALEFAADGPASMIRKVERAAHRHLQHAVIRSEWFRVPPSEAIEVVRTLLSKSLGA